MSKGVKITLIVVAVVVVLCCAGFVAAYLVGRQVLGQAIAVDQPKAARIGHEIVDYTLPSGYAEVYAMSVANVKTVFIGPTDESGGSLVLMLMQFPLNSNLSQEDMERQMQQAWAQQSQHQNVQMRVVGTQKVTIKGQPVTLTVSEGASGSSDVTMRQVVGVFTGKGGLVMLMVMGTVESWEQSTLDQFLSSIK